MENKVVYPSYIEELHGKISFSNYEIVAGKKFEKSAMIFNNILTKALIVDEDATPYHIEFIHNKQLIENQYIIHMDQNVTHIEAGNKESLVMAINVIIDIFSLDKKIEAKKITSKSYYMENNI